MSDVDNVIFIVFIKKKYFTCKKEYLIRRSIALVLDNKGASKCQQEENHETGYSFMIQSSFDIYYARLEGDRSPMI
jgi:hypothetical protein